MFAPGNVTDCSINNNLRLAIRGSVCASEGVLLKNPSPHLHNFRIIPFIMVLEVMGALSGTIKSDSA